jgi:hypothetical protein
MKKTRKGGEIKKEGWQEKGIYRKRRYIKTEGEEEEDEDEEA